MRRAFSLMVLAALATSTLPAATPPELFQKAKEEFRFGSYAAALATLDILEAESTRPGFESERAALLPGLLFYRGASLAALGRQNEARKAFEEFLSFQPNARLDPAMYPRKVIAALEETRTLLERKKRGPEEPAGSLILAYRAFRAEPAADPEAMSEQWAEGSVRVLLTIDERRDFERLSDAVARSEFVTQFWKARDPRPETPENEFRDEFERRVAFADSRFTQDETRGAMTDRGMVFILLGPPTYIGRKPLTTGEDANDPGVLNRYRTSDLRVAAAPGGTTSERAARIDKVTGPGTHINEAASNWREVWHYRRENLPKTVPYLQVDFEFVTKQGYGKAVLQRDTQVLDTLERAKKLLKRPGEAGRVG